MGLHSNYWDIGGRVYHADYDSPTTVHAKNFSSYNSKPSLEEAKRDLIHAWNNRWGSYPERRIIRLEVTLIEWVYS